jgi:hypothetical protein
MSVNDVIFLGMNTVELIAIPAMLVLFVFAVWYGVVRGADGSPVLWAKPSRAEPKKAAAPRKAA